MQSFEKLNFRNHLFPVVLFYIANFLLFAIYNYSNFYPNSLKGEILVTLSYSTLIFFFIYNYQTPLLLNKQIKLKPCVTVILICLFSGIYVYYLSNFLNKFFTQTAIESIYSNSHFSFIFSLIFICLFSSFLEEIAFRTFVFTHLRKLFPQFVSAMISSILFAFLHFSIISFLWLVPLGLLFVYYRIKYESIWYSIIGHFSYNTTIIIIENL